jgi:hypothetical protein
MMPNRCKLIAPTQLLLERPMFGPVTETEFVLHGVNEHRKAIIDARLFGFALGVAFAALVVSICVIMRVY